MNKSFTWVVLLLGAMAIIGCGPSEGDAVEQIEIDNSDYQEVSFSVQNENELCDLIDTEILQSYFPEAKDLGRNELGISQYGINNAGCRVTWAPNEVISGRQSGNYYHFITNGMIELRYNGNPSPETIDDFAEKSLNVRIKPTYDTSGIGSEIDESYTYVSGLGSIGIWNDGSSTLTFALGENHMFSVSVKYPLEPTKRLELAKKLSKSIIDQVAG